MSDLTPEEQRQKQAIYDQLSPRRRKFIDKIGFEKWDPFQKPFDPIDMRKSETNRTAKDIFREFMHGKEQHVSTEYNAAVLEMAMGVINKWDKTRAAFEFCRWYDRIIKEEGLTDLDWDSK